MKASTIKLAGFALNVIGIAIASYALSIKADAVDADSTALPAGKSQTANRKTILVWLGAGLLIAGTLLRMAGCGLAVTSGAP